MDNEYEQRNGGRIGEYGDIRVKNPAPGTRYDGGPNEGTRGLRAEPAQPGTRYDGGPDEGTRGPAR